MEPHSILAFTLVAAIAIASPGPATLMAINNSLAHGQRSAVMFFTALFPQFIDQSATLLPQFLILTSIFMALSVASLSLYAALASRPRAC